MNVIKYCINRIIHYGVTKIIPDSLYLKILYRAKMGKRLDLKRPVTYTEKLQWLKLYNHRPILTTMVDKFGVRAYIEEKIGADYLIPLVGGPWNSFDEIDFDKLPECFVLKTTHDSGGVIICKQKEKLDKVAAKKKLMNSLKTNFYWRYREWPYKNVKPQIIAEQYMEDESGYELKDYKFFCFNGEPKVMFVATDRTVLNEEVKFDFYDMDFTHLDIRNGHDNSQQTINKPKAFEEMKALAATLAKDMPHVRVDLYDINGRIYFGELTMFHFSGIVPFEPQHWDDILGGWINLPEKYLADRSNLCKKY